MTEGHNTSKNSIEALQIVFQHGLVQDLGWSPNYLFDRASFLQAKLRQFFSSMDVSSLPRDMQNSSVVTNLETSLSDGVAFRVSPVVKTYMTQSLNQPNPLSSDDPHQMVSIPCHVCLYLYPPLSYAIHTCLLMYRLQNTIV